MENPKVIKEKKPKLSVEEQSNSQENPSLLLFSRLRNPEIFEQLVSTYENYYKNNREKDSDLREKIIRGFKERIKQIESSTVIDLDPNADESSGYIGFEFLSDETDFRRERIKTPLKKEEWHVDRVDFKKLDKIQEIIESHEKGHVVRQFWFHGDLETSLDPSAIKYDLKKLRENYEKGKKEGHGFLLDESDASLTKQATREYLSEPEIAERMSQLKGYFGMRGSEKFTKEHLDYARKHYITDTGLDNWMTEFFQGITEKTEPRFLELINSSGI